VSDRTPLLSIRGLSVTMPSREGGPETVVKEVDLDVERGESLALVGESGCGKTTTLLSILGLLPRGAKIESGEISFAGRDLRRAEERELRAVRGGQIGVIWQDPLAALDPVMRAGHQIAEVVRAHAGGDRRNRRAAERRAKELLRLVELPDVERLYDAYPHELSGGQRQRVVIAAAIAADPVLLLADEPTTALDVTVQDQVLALLARLRDELGLALLLVTHDLAVVSETCERVAIMYAGRIVESGPAARVLSAPRHHYSAGLLAAAPDVDRPGVRPAGIAGTPPAGVALDRCAFAPRCPRADDVCTSRLPELAGEPSHLAACHHPRAATPAGAGKAAPNPDPDRDRIRDCARAEGGHG
jgi:peptide/nickel transport system ATP-binding protein